MRRLYIYILTAISILGISTSCDNFNDVNIDPEHPNDGNMDYTLIFSQVQAQIAGSDWDIWRNGCIYTMNMMQHTTAPTWSQGTFYTWSEQYNAAYWDSFYKGEDRGALRNVIDLVDRWKNDPSLANEYQYARVMKAYLFQRMTDLYGDVPYFQAGKGLSGIAYPVYDKQEVIYDDLLKELDEVNTALKTPSTINKIKTQDVLYKGDAEKWRTFANSLMLRVAMRLTKVNPDKAKIWANKAFTNGLFGSAADEAVLVRTDAVVTNDSAEPYGKILSNEDPQAFYLSEYFINNLKSTEDPRLQMIATRCDNPNIPWANGSSFDFGNNTDPDKLIGMPIGYSSGPGEWNLENAPGYPKDGLWRKYYALANRYTYARPDGPSMLVTYTENCFLLADAAARGFISGSAKDYYRKGVEAAMQQFTYYNAAKRDYELYLSPTKVSAYINKRLTAFDENPLKEINWQYYITTFCDEYETFANWRRTGYPELKSVYAAPYNRPIYPNSVTSEIPRRFTYPSSETQNNEKNYNAAVALIDGGDKMSSRVWWDKK